VSRRARRLRLAPAFAREIVAINIMSRRVAH
jgi:hypothetical protein